MINFGSPYPWGDELEVPLALGERIAEHCAQALQRYGNLDRELLAARLIADRAQVDFTARSPIVSF